MRRKTSFVCEPPGFEIARGISKDQDDLGIRIVRGRLFDHKAKESRIKGYEV